MKVVLLPASKYINLWYLIVYSNINESNVKPTTDEKFWNVVNIIPIPPSKTMRWQISKTSLIKSAYFENIFTGTKKD